MLCFGGSLRYELQDRGLSDILQVIMRIQALVVALSQRKYLTDVLGRFCAKAVGVHAPLLLQVGNDKAEVRFYQFELGIGSTDRPKRLFHGGF